MAIQSPEWAEPSIAIRKAGAFEIPQLSRTLAHAFADDPVFEWVVPDAQRRHRMLPALFGIFARAVQHHEAMYLAGEDVGAAIWVPAGQPAIHEADAEAFGEALEQICGADAQRAFAVSDAMEAEHPIEDHEYLWFLGVEPSWQGVGIGSMLIRPVLARCDREQMPAYLEATSLKNVRLYERHGFEVINCIDAHGGAPLFAMWREPLAI